MHEPIVCSCGLCVGHLLPAFVAMKEELYREAFGGEEMPDPVYMNLLDVKIELGGILDALEIRAMCCRRTVLTYAPMREYY